MNRLKLLSCNLAAFLFLFTEQHVRSQTPFERPTLQPAEGLKDHSIDVSGGSVHFIQGIIITGDYELYGSKYDGLVLTKSIIKGTLKLDGVKNLIVKDNQLNSIWFRGNQPTDSVTIDHNQISGATNDCIHVHDGTSPARHVIIENNDIHDCGVGHPTSNLYHAIYDQVPGVVIQGNCISSARAAISVRSNALIQDNFIENVISGGAIEYFSDHDAEPGKSLTLKGNVISSALPNEPSLAGSNRGLIVLGNDIGKDRRPVSFFDIRDNKLAVLNRQENEGGGRFSNVYVQSNAQDVRLTNNLLINLIPNGQFYPVVGAESNNEETHDPRSLSRIANSTRPACH